jgi:hypothetical protein
MQARPTAMGSDSTISRNGRQDPPLPDTDLAQAAGSNFLSNSALEPRSTGYGESLIRPQAEAAADDFLHDLGGRRIGMSRQHAAVMQSAGCKTARPAAGCTPARVVAASPTRIPRTKRDYATHDGTAANRASLALDKPLCR